MNTVRVWHIESAVVAIFGIVLLMALPVFGVLGCFVLCNVGLVLGIRNLDSRFAVAGITFSVVGLLLSFVWLIMALSSIHYVAMSQY